MKFLFSLPLLATVIFAATWPVQDKEKCTPNTNFVDSAGSPFLRECKLFGKTQTFSTVIACLDPSGNQVPIGGSFDQIRDEKNGNGFRFSCSTAGGRTEIKPTACIFAKGTAYEQVTSGTATIAQYNMKCSCTESSTRYRCQMLN